MTKKSLIPTTLALSILFLGCGANNNRSQRNVYATNAARARYFLGDDADFSQTQKRNEFYRILYSDEWVAVDESSGAPFRGTTLNFAINGVHPAFSLVLPDATGAGDAVRPRQYIGEIHTHSLDDTTLEWIVLRPKECGMSRILFDSLQTTQLGMVMRISFVRSCASSEVANRLNNASRIEIDEGIWSFQRASEVKARIARQALSKDDKAKAADPVQASQAPATK